MLFHSHVFLRNLIKLSINKFDINPPYCVSLPGYTWQCGLEYSGKNLQTLQDKDMIPLLENNYRGRISSVMADSYDKKDEKKTINTVAIDLYCHSMSQRLPYDGKKKGKNVKLEFFLNIPYDSDNGYFVEVDFPDNITEKNKEFPFCC